MAENDPQLHAIHYAFGALRLYCAARPDVYVCADLLVHDPATGRDLLSHAEERAARQAAESRADAAEERLAHIEALLRRQNR